MLANIKVVGCKVELGERELYMALIWEKVVRQSHYEVKSAGNSVRLYTNGIFHSQWNSKRALSGHLWDLLVLPIFCHPNYPAIQKILSLGVGGGAAIQAINSLFDIRSITGVDLDKTHLQIAKRFFNCKASNIQLVHANAVDFISESKESYDLIIEDLFAGSAADSSDARRAIDFDEAWLKALSSRLSNHGMLIVNFEDDAQLRACKKLLKFSDFDTNFSFRSARYENTIGVFLKTQSSLSTYKNQAKKFLNSPTADKILDGFHVKNI
jgi:spermidine synthase